MTSSVTQDISLTIDAQQRVKLSGSLTRTTVPSIWTRWCKEVCDKQVTEVDVSEVDSVDTAGVALLLELAKQHPNQSITCVGANNQLQQIAAVSGVDRLLSLS